MASTHTPKDYVRIWLILLVLLVISVAGPFLEIPIITLITAFGIAVVKASMVVKHFMHLTVEKPIMKYLLAISVVLMALFWGGVAPDVQAHDGHQWENYAAKEAVERGIDSGEGADEEH